jgi:hypothetical protein
MTCHRTNDNDWSDYTQFEPLGTLSRGKPYLELYIANAARHRKGVPFMPQAELLFNQLQLDPNVRPAVNAWVSALGGPSCEVGTTCTPARLCFQGAIEECGETKVTCAPTVPSPDGTPCGPDKTCSSGQCLETITITIPHINPGVYVRNDRKEADQAHVHVNINGTLLVAQLAIETMCVRAETEVTMSCNLSTLVCTDPGSGETWKVIEGNTLERANPAHPELDGVYRLESPIDVPSCP